MDDILKSLFKTIKAIAVRRKAPTIDVLIATTLPITFPNLEAEIGALTSAAARESRGPQAVRYVSRAFDLASNFVGIAPVVGSPMKSAIETLVKILDAIARHTQNKEDISRLKTRLCCLEKDVSNFPIASPQVRGLQNYLSGRLKKASMDLNELLDRPKLQYQEVAQAIDRCCRDISDSLQDFIARAVMYLLVQTQLQGPSVGTSGCITLMDPFGNPRRILLDRLRTFQQFKAEIRNLYPPNTQRNHILQVYMDDNLFDICIDTGMQVREIVDDQDLYMNAQPNTTLVMRILFFQTRSRKIESFECPLCNRINNIPKGSMGASIDCEYCERRLHISDENIYHTRNKKEARLTYEEQSLIRNYHIKSYLVCFAR